jgi:uncharacterized alpha-E superfamily protein
MMPLLSRTAENLYWLGRHLERLESTARVVAEHTNLLIDLPIEVESNWSSLVSLVGGEQLFADRHPTATESDVVAFLLVDPTNPSSVVATLAAARENLRATRELTTSTAWEALNQLHVALRSVCPRPSRSQALAICDLVRSAGQQLAGIMTLLMDRDHGYALYGIGRHLERADLTIQVLDSRVGAILSVAGGPVEPADRSPFEDVRWLGMLRATDSVDLYRRCTQSPVEARSVVQFLLAEWRSPRSLAWCLDQVNQALTTLPPRKLPAVACANALSAVGRGVPLPLSREGFHLHVDTLGAGPGGHTRGSQRRLVRGRPIGWRCGPPFGGSP